MIYGKRFLNIWEKINIYMENGSLIYAICVKNDMVKVSLLCDTYPQYIRAADLMELIFARVSRVTYSHGRIR